MSEQRTIDNARGSIERCTRVITEQNDEINAFLEVFDPPVGGETDTGVLADVPIAIKDNILVQGEIASAASRMLEPYTAVYDATAVRKLRDAGAQFIGRTNMDEFAMGASTENSAFGVTRNPRAPSRVPGGSSGGSAAAVAMGAVPVAIGSDTGGSIRQPASFCGAVGLKPTYGAVSRAGLIAMGSSLDQIGPITNTVADAETVFSVLRGSDERDSTTLPDSAYSESGGEPRTIGIPWGLIQRDGVTNDVIENMKEAAQQLSDLGYEMVDIELPAAHYALSAYYIIMPAEVSSNLARFDGVRYGLREEGEDVNDTYKRTRASGFGDEVRRRIMLGTHVLSSGYHDAYYRNAMRARRVIRAEMDRAFTEVDCIATPTTPTPPFVIGEKSNDPLAMYMADLFTVPANIAGVPALSVPSGTVQDDNEELPLGMQFMAPHTREDALFAVGKRFNKES